MNNQKLSLNKMTYTLLNILLLFYYLIGLTKSNAISFNLNEKRMFSNHQYPSSNVKLNWLLQTCMTDVEEVLMGLAQRTQMVDHEPDDADDQLFLLINCEGMGLFINKLQSYHQHLLDFPVTALDDNNSQMNKWFKRTEKNIRKHLSKLQSDCAPSWNLQDIMDNFLDCLLKTGYSVGRGAENSYVDESLVEEQRIQSLLLALASRSVTDRQSDERPSSGNQYEHVGEIDLMLDSHIRELPATFLSVALGSRLIQNDWERFNTSSPLLRTLASALSPAILRMGGTSANYLTFDPQATNKKHFHSCQDTNGLQLEDLDPFNLEDMYDSNIDGNPFNLKREHETNKQPSEGNLLAHENTFNDYYYDNTHLNDDWFVWPDQTYFDNIETDLEIKTRKFEEFGSSNLANDPIDTLRNALLNSNRHQESFGFRNIDENYNAALSSNNVQTNKINSMNDWAIFDMTQHNLGNGVSSVHENTISSSMFPLKFSNNHKEKLHSADTKSEDITNENFSFGHLVYNNLHESHNIQNKKIGLQNRNGKYWSQDQPLEEKIPGYQLRRSRRNLDSLHQNPLTDFLTKSLNSRNYFSSTTNDQNVDDSHNGLHKMFGPDVSNILKSDNDFTSSPTIEADVVMENNQNLDEHHTMNMMNPEHPYYDLGVKHLYKDKQSNNQGSQDYHDWVYHHDILHNHDLREHLENNIDSNTEFRNNESENNQHADQHINNIPLYGDQGCGCEYLKTVYTNFTMTGDDLSDLLEFVEAVNMTLLWDMNHLYREADGGWDPTNARMIMQEVSRKKQTVIWQLGNEPNSYAHHTEFSISGRQEALDYGVFRRELLSVFPEVTIVGPDTTRPRFHGNRIEDAFGLRSDSVAFMREFLEYGNQDIDVVSWHQYYLDGRIATVNDFMDPALMDVLIKQLDTMVAVRDELAPTKPMWLTETASAYGGGAPDLSNRYAAGFLWLDKLGLSARKGVDLVARQTLYHGCYALLDPYLQPYPDYWLSVIYKQQVGGRVLDMQLSTSTPTVRLYAHCLNTNSQHYKQGGVIVYGMNLGDKGASVNLQGRLNETQVLEMLLQPPEGDLQSSSVMLNGVVVELTSQMNLPSLNARPSGIPGTLHIPKQSMGFWLLPFAEAQACN